MDTFLYSFYDFQLFEKTKNTNFKILTPIQIARWINLSRSSSLPI